MTIHSVNEEQSLAINALLSDLLVLSESDAVFLSDNGGNLIASSTVDQSPSDTIYTIAALAAGSFCATRELASLIKEPSFQSIFHQGDRTSIYMRSVGPDYLLLIIFGKGTPVGIVKLYVDRSMQELEPILKQIETQGGLSSRIGNIFELSGKEAFLKKPDPQA